MNKVAKSTIGLMIATMLSKALGFGREVVLGAAYGASTYSDIYIVAMNIPTILFAAIGAALGTTFIPLYYENHNLYGREKAIRFSNNIFNIVVIMTIVISLITFIFAEEVINVVAMGFEGETLNTAIKFTRIMIFGGIFLGISNIMTSFLQVENNFIVPGLIGIPFNIIIIISIILSLKINIYILPVGTLIAIASQFLFQLPFAYKKGYKYTPILNIRDKYVQKMICLVGPVFMGVAVNQINAMIDKTLASTLAEGSISALNYANRLNGFVMALFITSIGSVIYPLLSKLSNDKSNEEFVRVITKSINSVVLLVIPISIGAIILSKPIVKLLFQRGAFDERATYMTSIALVFYSVGLIGLGLREILGRIFYSLKDTKTPMLNGAITMIINIILNIVLIDVMGYAGLAFATSISALICIILLFINLKKKIGYFGQDKIFKVAMKSLIASSIMAIITFTIYNLLHNETMTLIYEFIVLILSIGIGAISYSILIILLKVEEINIIIKKLRKLKFNYRKYVTR